MSISEKSATILVVDDEEQIRRALKSILTIRKYRVILASSGEEALDRAIDHPPDLVILDLSLPGIGGVEVCRELRTWSNSPILILSVKSNDADKISALDSGADDYLT
ncbi:MAG TPA: DNA-binding response regulator, partial [Cyanobacteria bacterium UBA8530]|nr:DNA-binding response regulator [Cyanobacteria bacterium UBA8530]